MNANIELVLEYDRAMQRYAKLHGYPPESDIRAIATSFAIDAIRRYRLLWETMTDEQAEAHAKGNNP